MGKTINSGMGFGAGKSAQGSVFQNNVDTKIEELAEKEMMSKLEGSGVKYSKENVLFVIEDKSGQLIWLESGNESAGLQHILYGDGKSSRGHAEDFKNALGLEADEVPSYLKKVIANGEIVSEKIRTIYNRKGYEKTYYYEDDYYIVTGIGDNGFIVSAYPKRKGDK